MLLNNIVGHAQPKKILRNALADSRVAHAYLFHGSAGVGKKSLARAFAVNLLCPNRTSDACGVCAVCRRVMDNKHPDFFIIEPSGNNIKIEQIREIQKKAQFRPYEGNKKVFLLAEAENMTRDAANCLLKVLEEPPSDTLFLLTTNNLYSLIATIVSRCQAIPLGKVSVSEIEDLLFNNGIEREKAKLFAALSDGIPGIALELAASDEGHEIRELVFQLEENIQKGDINELLKFAEELEKRKDLPQFIEYLTLWYRDRLVWLQTKDEDLIINLDRLSNLNEGFEDREKLMKCINNILEAKSSLNQNVNTRLVIEVLLLRLSGLAS